MFQFVLALLTGFSMGLMFSVLRLPIPAPPTLSGIAGIIGIWLGYVTFRTMLGR